MPFLESRDVVSNAKPGRSFGPIKPRPPLSFFKFDFPVFNLLWLLFWVYSCRYRRFGHSLLHVLQFPKASSVIPFLFSPRLSEIFYWKPKAHSSAKVLRAESILRLSPILLIIRNCWVKVYNLSWYLFIYLLQSITSGPLIKELVPRDSYYLMNHLK